MNYNSGQHDKNKAANESALDERNIDRVVLFISQLFVAETNISTEVEVYIVNLSFLRLKTWLYFYLLVTVSISPVDVLSSCSDNSKDITYIILLSPYLSRLT